MPVGAQLGLKLLRLAALGDLRVPRFQIHVRT